MKQWIAAVVALAAFGLAPQAGAVGRLADVVVYDRAQNRTLPVYVHEGRHYVVGRPGNEYEIRLRSRQRGDLLTVVSVDGIDVITGETADWQQSGYVLGARENFAVKGWRKSLDRVAAFYFTALPDSYAARTGRPDNVGVIGVAVFRRKPEPVLRHSPPRWSRGPADAESVAQAPAAVERSVAVPDAGRDDLAGSGAASRAEGPTTTQKSARLGTGHGQIELSQVTYTDFERASVTPAEIITIYYDSYRNLVAQGVIRAPVIARPDPFPSRFAPDPR
ncbi:MAG: hypothetical protein AB7E73_12340 [Burkholderiales bacterium]